MGFPSINYRELFAKASRVLSIPPSSLSPSALNQFLGGVMSITDRYKAQYRKANKSKRERIVFNYAREIMMFLGKICQLYEQRKIVDAEEGLSFLWDWQE